MGEITKAIYDRLVGDATLAAMLSVYPAGTGTPAVFTTDPVPEDANFPYIVSAGEVAQTPSDTKTTRLREVFRDIRIYDDADGGADAIEDIQERVRDLLHRFQLVVTGYTTVVARAAGMTVADEKDVYGRIVTVHLTLEET